jgi:hypothetical protein
MSGCRSAFHGNPERGINNPIIIICCDNPGCNINHLFCVGGRPLWHLRGLASSFATQYPKLLYRIQILPFYEGYNVYNFVYVHIYASFTVRFLLRDCYEVFISNILSWHDSVSYSSVSYRYMYRSTTNVNVVCIMIYNSIMRLTLEVFDRTDVYDHACLSWCEKAEADQMLPLFKTHFIAANRECQHRLTAQAAGGFHGANAAAAANAANNWQRDAAGGVPPANNGILVGNIRMSYCWTRGLLITNCNHHSGTCTNPRQGHVATPPQFSTCRMATTVATSHTLVMQLLPTATHSEGNYHPSNL